MTNYSAFGVNGNGANGAASSTSYSGPWTAGVLFEVTSSGNYLQGYYSWRADSSQGASTSFALWTVNTSNGTGSLVASSTASTSGETVGQWNYAALATPIALSTGVVYSAVYGRANNFPEQAGQFGTGGLYVGGIRNGPLHVYSGPAGDGGTDQAPIGVFYPQMAFGVAGSDPTANFPASDSGNGSNWGIDVLVGPAATATAPAPLLLRPGKTWLRRYHHRQIPAPALVQPLAGATAAAAAAAAAATAPSAAVTVNAGVAAVSAAATGATPGVYRIWPSTSGPATATSNTGDLIVSTGFAVKGGNNWLEGYWWWVCGSGQSTTAVKCALWSIYQGSGPVTGSVVPGSVVTSGTLTAGQWNYIPLSTPIQLGTGWDTNSTVNGSIYLAAVGVNGNFPDTASYWASGNPGASGITNGPLVAYSDNGSGTANKTPYTLGQGMFSTAGTDPSVTLPFTDSTADNLWVDVQVSTSAPGAYSGSYRLWPGKADANPTVTGDAAFNYTIATEIHLTAACTLNNIWYFSPAGATTLATRCDVWDISTGVSVASITSPSWEDASGSPFTATGAGSPLPGYGTWIKAAFAGGINLPPGSYRVSVYNSSGTSDANWSPKDADTDYWGETLTGAGAGGITWGPLYAPDYPNASAGYLYGGPSTATPPYSNGTVSHAQPVFGQTGSGAIEFPNLYAPVGASGNQSQNYWVDLEVTINATGAATLASVVQVAAVAPAAAVTVTPGIATVAATVAPPGRATAGTATVQAAATAPSTAETVTAGTGTVAAGAVAATVSTSSSTTANAGIAAVACAAVAPAVAEATAAGTPAIAAAGVAATVSTSGSTSASAGVAAAAAAAVAPTTAIVITAGTAAVASSAVAASVTTFAGTSANAGIAVAGCTALAPALTLHAGPAAGIATVLAAGVPIPPTLLVARSNSTVVPAATSASAVVPAAASASAVTDPRDGTAGVS